MSPVPSAHRSGVLVLRRHRTGVCAPGAPSLDALAVGRWVGGNGAFLVVNGGCRRTVEDGPSEGPTRLDFEPLYICHGQIVRATAYTEAPPEDFPIKICGASGRSERPWYDICRSRTIPPSIGRNDAHVLSTLCARSVKSCVVSASLKLTPPRARALGERANSPNARLGPT